MAGKITKHTVLRILSYLAVLVIGVMIGTAHPKSATANNQANGSSTLSVAPAKSSLSLNQSPTPKPEPKTLLDISGQGNQQTETFSTNNNWQLTYTFDCSNYSDRGNFMVEVTNSDDSFNGDTPVNDLAATGGKTNHYYDAGIHYLKISSECNWHVTVTD